MAFLHQILRDTAQEMHAAKKRYPLAELKRMIRDAPPVRSLFSALSGDFGLIAEVKRRSPSGGDMLEENFKRAPGAYAKSPIVKAVSVLTNETHFGMGIKELARIKKIVPKPILRKDFIFSEYQVYQSRAFGADALLLMTNVLDQPGLRQLFDLASAVGLEILFETHSKAEIRDIPKEASLCGVNSRNFKAAHKLWHTKKNPQGDPARAAGGPDRTVEFKAFSLIEHLPKRTLKVAESGVQPDRIAEVARMGYNAVLVGTSLLKAPKGVEDMLHQFERALRSASRQK
jgi:indole-3-glycerol phosphate synthase